MPRYEPPPGPLDDPEDPDERASPADAARLGRLRERRERYDVDMVGFAPREHDVRVERDGWVYYVRVARWGEALGVSPFRAAVRRQWRVAPFAGLAWLVWSGVVRARRSRPWQVGVVRAPSKASWNTGEPTVVHRERLECSEDPRRRVAELAADAEGGRFAPVTQHPVT